MATGSLLPLARLQAFNSSGVVLPGALLNVYYAGTSTRFTTYSDSGLTTPNTNPVVADSGGLFGPIYLPAGSVKLVLTTSAGVTVWSQDNVQSATTAYPQIAGGRLTASTGNPIGESSGVATLYYTPYISNSIALYDGTNWNYITFTETSLSLTGGVALTVYDIFGYSNAGVLTLERLAWSSLTARATALTYQDGVLVKSGATTRRYLGTIYSGSAGNVITDSASQRFLWNMYNRIPRNLFKGDATANWTYSTAAWRSANNSTTNRVEIVTGQAEDVIDLSVNAQTSSAAAAGFNIIGIGEDATTSAPPTGFLGGVSGCLTTTSARSGRLTKIPAVGYHFYQWIEFGSGGTDTWYGSGVSGLGQSGLNGSIWA